MLDCNIIHNGFLNWYLLYYSSILIFYDHSLSWNFLNSLSGLDLCYFSLKRYILYSTTTLRSSSTNLRWSFLKYTRVTKNWSSNWHVRYSIRWKWRHYINTWKYLFSSASLITLSISCLSNLYYICERLNYNSFDLLKSISSICCDSLL